MIEEKLATIPGFPPAKRLLVEHLVLSHHGEYEFGLPKLPMTPEAILLHYSLDNLYAKMQTVRSEFARSQANGRSGAEMTEWVRSMERPLLDTQAYLKSEEIREVGESATEPRLTTNGKKRETMPYLLKTEPGTYSVADLAREGETLWDGVSNPAAVKNLAAMQRGEMLVIYHTGDENSWGP